MGDNSKPNPKTKSLVAQKKRQDTINPGFQLKKPIGLTVSLIILAQ
jgi:hypothetical protein